MTFEEWYQQEGYLMTGSGCSHEVVARAAFFVARQRNSDEIESLSARVAKLEKLSVSNIMIAIVPGDGDGEEVFAQSVEEVESVLTELSERAENYDLETAHLRQQLAAKDQRIAELEEQLDLQIPAGVMAQQMKTIAAQALTIKTMQRDKDLLIEAWNFGQFSDDFNVSQAKPVRVALRRLCEALTLPDNSTEVLQEWLDKQLDEQVWCEWQPIETAPKDGTAVLVTNGGGVWIAKHKAVYQSGYKPDNPWFCLMLNKDHIPPKLRRGCPTHWIPLPPPPEIK